MKCKKILTVFLCAVLMAALCAFPIHADMGPKPSVHVDITGLSGELYYVTLLSKTSSTGPASAYDGTYATYEESDEGYEIWKHFVDYEDADGFYFLQQFKKCEGDTEYVWGYYPPHTFKILFYFPEYDTFVTTNIHERYAFDSYFTVDFSHVDPTVPQIKGAYLPAVKSYDHTWETVSLAVRIVLTILLELALALLFGYRKKNVLLLLAGVNAVTQIALNVILNAVNFTSGHYAFVAYYIFLEIIIFAIEAAAYALTLPKLTDSKRGRAVLYSLLANGLSFAAGLGLAMVIPGIF